MHGRKGSGISETYVVVSVVNVSHDEGYRMRRLTRYAFGLLRIVFWLHQVKITDVALPSQLQERLERTTAYKTKIEEQ